MLVRLRVARSSVPLLGTWTRGRRCCGDRQRPGAADWPPSFKETIIAEFWKKTVVAFDSAENQY